jgi:hypothetical protein
MGKTKIKCLILLIIIFSWSGEVYAFDGPLKKSEINSRYFTDNSGKVIYLTGSHTWDNLQDFGNSDPPPAFDYGAYLSWMRERGHNFMRMWVWEQAKGSPGYAGGLYCTPNVYQRTGLGTALDGKPKFDLTKFNQNYFDRLHARVIEAGNKNIYVSVMLFEGFSVGKKDGADNPWPGHPFNGNNNIQGINGDTNGDGEGYETQTLQNPTINNYQKAYINKVIDTVQDLDNVLYEISNESAELSGAYSNKAWQYAMIDYVKSYETSQGYKKHPVGMTFAWPGGSNADLFSSPADWISPNYADGYKDNPPINSGAKVIFSDTDHYGCDDNLQECDRRWVWKSFTRGLNPIWMDAIEELPGEPSPWPDLGWYENTRYNMGYALEYANKMNLKNTVPSNNVAACSTTYCLRNDQGREYLIYQPENDDFTANVQAGDYIQEWFNPQTGSLFSQTNINIAASGSHEFLNPFAGDAVLYLKAGSILPPQNTLVVAYSFNEGSGNSTGDASGKGNNGQISGATWSGGKFGQSLVFDGVNDWVTVADADSLDLTSGMTLEAWISPTRNSGYQTVMMKEYSYFNSEGANDFAYALFLNLDRIMGGLRVSGEGDDIYGVNISTNGTWTHVAFTHDGTLQKIYVNGQEKVSTNQAPGYINVSNYPLRIGGNDVWGEYFQGLIDEVRVYNYALSQNQIQADMNTPIVNYSDITAPAVPTGLMVN